MAKNFETAHAFAQKWEGGEKFTQNPKDPGGATKFGLSIRFLKDLPLDMTDIDHDGQLTWKDVQAMPKDKADAIYKAYFWEKLKLSDPRMPDRLAMAVYDTAINIGRGGCAIWLQKALGVKMDGGIGPMTLNAIQGFSEDDLIKAVLNSRFSHYTKLYQEEIWAKEFYNGWVNRLNALKKAINFA
jgi:lysozyme family protein